MCKIMLSLMLIYCVVLGPALALRDARANRAGTARLRGLSVVLGPSFRH
jgi:hypothetical protein